MDRRYKIFRMPLFLFSFSNWRILGDWLICLSVGRCDLFSNCFLCWFNCLQINWVHKIIYFRRVENIKYRALRNSQLLSHPALSASFSATVLFKLFKKMRTRQPRFQAPLPGNSKIYLWNFLISVSPRKETWEHLARPDSSGPRRGEK